METKEHTIINVSLNEEECKALNTTIELIDKIATLLDTTDVYNMETRTFFDRETMVDTLDFIRRNFVETEN